MIVKPRMSNSILPANLGLVSFAVSLAAACLAEVMKTKSYNILGIHP
jgi:hypothetical protein